MNKMLTLAVFGVATFVVATAFALAAPPVKAWNAADMCLVWYTTEYNEAMEIPTGYDIVYAADAADLGCMEALYECTGQGIPGIYLDGSWTENC